MAMHPDSPEQKAEEDRLMAMMQTELQAVRFLIARREGQAVGIEWAMRVLTEFDRQERET
jgi:hypothetical protein